MRYLVFVSQPMVILTPVSAAVFILHYAICETKAKVVLLSAQRKKQRCKRWRCFNGNIPTGKNFQLKNFKASNQFCPCWIHLEKKPQIFQGLKEANTPTSAHKQGKHMSRCSNAAVSKHACCNFFQCHSVSLSADKIFLDRQQDVFQLQPFTWET